MLLNHNEAFSRVLIDRALGDSDWELLDSKQVEFEFHTASGRADYLLNDKLGRVLCVLEAKREDADPYDAKQQARGYAENLNAPFVILSNGQEHWFWNLQHAKEQDAYRIERLPSQEDLERVRLKNLQPSRPLLTEVIRPNYLYRLKPDLKLRGYQIKAMDAIAQPFDTKGRRKFLLEMATGTGKTLLCAALIRRFLVTRNAERVLFIVDRIELAKSVLEERQHSPACPRESEGVGSPATPRHIQLFWLPAGRTNDHFAHSRFVIVRKGISRRQASRAHRCFSGHAFDGLQLPRPAQCGPYAPGLFADRIHPNQRARHTPVHLRHWQYRLREEMVLPSGFLRRGRILRGEIRLRRSAYASASQRRESCGR